jgi:hypothetical protein
MSYVCKIGTPTFCNEDTKLHVMLQYLKENQHMFWELRIGANLSPFSRLTPHMGRQHSCRQPTAPMPVVTRPRLSLRPERRIAWNPEHVLIYRMLVLAMSNGDISIAYLLFVSMFYDVALKWYWVNHVR